MVAADAIVCQYVTDGMGCKGSRGFVFHAFRE
jgi:hypothetical protein